MLATVHYSNRAYEVDFSQPIDISLAMYADGNSVNAFYLPKPEFIPFRYGTTVLSRREGGACNCEVLTIAPHGNGTHTECVGHISTERITINQCLKEFIFFAEIITVRPIQYDVDYRITKQQLESAILHDTEALIIRTLPNDSEKMTQSYSGTNPAFVDADALDYLRERGVKHLLIDLPSVDRETDGGAMLAHHAYWNYPGSPRLDATITELIYVHDSIPDGLYLLTIQIASLETDASPSKPVVYTLSHLT